MRPSPKQLRKRRARRVEQVYSDNRRAKHAITDRSLRDLLGPLPQPPAKQGCVEYLPTTRWGLPLKNAVRPSVNPWWLVSSFAGDMRFPNWWTANRYVRALSCNLSDTPPPFVPPPVNSRASRLMDAVCRVPLTDRRSLRSQVSRSPAWLEATVAFAILSTPQLEDHICVVTGEAKQLWASRPLAVRARDLGIWFYAPCYASNEKDITELRALLEGWLPDGPADPGTIIRSTHDLMYDLAPKYNPLVP